MAPSSRRARTDYIRMGTTSAGHSQLNLCWEAEVALNTTVCGIQKVDLGEEGEDVPLSSLGPRASLFLPGVPVGGFNGE